jgi:predicted enzyme related to lactoylglutathione lyase
MLNQTGAFGSFSVDNLETAKKFYGETLGIDVKEEMGGHILSLQISSVGCDFPIIYPKPDHQPATFTVLNFKVADVEQTVDDLTAKGVKFEHYDMGELKTDAKGIARFPGITQAWFKDPAGNILSVMKPD